MIRIVKYTDTYIEFDNGTTISYYHYPQCCEENYADFSVLDIYSEELKLDYEYFEIEPVEETGFNLILHRTNMYGIPKDLRLLIPCYSYQNGYYSCDLDIYVHNKNGDIREHYNLECEMCFY